MAEQGTPERHDPRVLRLKGALLALWALIAFGSGYLARDLSFEFGTWPFHYWLAAQGALVGFIAIVAFYAWAMRHLAPEDDATGDDADA